MAFPPGITVEGATPRNGEGRWWILACTTSPSLVPHQRQKTGGRSLHFLPLPCGATKRRARGWTRDAGTALRFTPEDSGNPCQPTSNAGFREQPGPQRRGLRPLRVERWGLLKGRATTCATSVRHPPFVRWSPIRRHVLDPRRRKSSIISRPLEAGFSCSHWTIFSMTTSRLAWRSTVSSCTLNPRALPGRLNFLTPWHSRAPRNASWTDSPLRDRRSRRLWGRPELPAPTVNRSTVGLWGVVAIRSGPTVPDVTVSVRP